MRIKTLPKVLWGKFKDYNNGTKALSTEEHVIADTDLDRIFIPLKSREDYSVVMNNTGSRDFWS